MSKHWTVTTETADTRPRTRLSPETAGQRRSDERAPAAGAARGTGARAEGADHGREGAHHSPHQWVLTRRITYCRWNRKLRKIRNAFRFILQLPVAAPDNRAVFYDLMGDQTYLAGRHGQRRYSKLRPERRLADTRYARQIGMCNSIVARIGVTLLQCRVTTRIRQTKKNLE